MNEEPGALLRRADEAIISAEQVEREAKAIMRAARSKAARIIRDILRQQGRCIDCARPSGGYTRCERHREKARDDAKRLRHAIPQ